MFIIYFFLLFCCLSRNLVPTKKDTMTKSRNKIPQVILAWQNREIKTPRIIEGKKNREIKYPLNLIPLKYLNYSSRRLLFNALIQPHFDYGCTSWYPPLSKALKTKLQIAQNKCIRQAAITSNYAMQHWFPVSG